MLKVRHQDIKFAGGFLGALTEVSTAYLATVVRDCVKSLSKELPDKLITHTAPHLDDYFAEMIFRASLSSEARQREYLEMAIHSEQDLVAELTWPVAAVFGIGSGKPCGEKALYLYDEHITTGGRTKQSCSLMVAEERFTALPLSVRDLLDEVSAIDSEGGAHPQHLNNLLKTSHQVLYNFGTTANGHRRSGKLPDSWKRAVVNAIIAALVYAREHGFDISSTSVLSNHVRTLFDRFANQSLFTHFPGYEHKLNRIRGNCCNIEGTLGAAKFPKSTADRQQLLIIPIICSAVIQVWGEEIGYFIMVHFWESELLKDLHFERIHALVEQCFPPKQSPQAVYRADCSLKPIILSRRQFIGIKSLGSGKSVPAKYPSNLWIVSCRHGNSILQPNKAITKFINDSNFGVGLVLVENTREGTKALFKCQGIPESYWSALRNAIYDFEPGLWFEVSDQAAFIVNRNAAHQDIEISSLTAGRLAKLCLSTNA